MNTIITLTANGNVAPNRPIDLGFKYENVGDVISFSIPEEYIPYHHYLVFYMKKHDTILLPVNDLTFRVTTTITRNPGTYEMVFIATENVVVDGDIDGARKVFVSGTMVGNVKDNFLQDPVTTEELDPNLQIVYDQLLDLQRDLTQKVNDDYYRGTYYIPDVSEVGLLSWTRADGKDIQIPIPRNITGPRGDYYVPSADVNGVISWIRLRNTAPSDPNKIELYPLVERATNSYLDTNLAPLVKTNVDAAVDNKFKWEWDSANQILYITTEAGHDVEGTK